MTINDMSWAVRYLTVDDVLSMDVDPESKAMLLLSGDYWQDGELWNLAVWQARLTLESFERHYPDNHAPQQAIEYACQVAIDWEAGSTPPEPPDEIWGLKQQVVYASYDARYDKNKAASMAAGIIALMITRDDERTVATNVALSIAALLVHQCDNLDDLSSLPWAIVLAHIVRHIRRDR